MSMGEQFFFEIVVGFDGEYWVASLKSNPGCIIQAKTLKELFDKLLELLSVDECGGYVG